MYLLSAKWAPVLRRQGETGMGYQICTVLLKDGRRFDKVMIDSGYVTKVGESTEIPFVDDEIADIVVTHGKYWAPGI